MKQFGKLLLLTLGFGILAAVLSSVTSGPVSAQDPGPPGGLGVRVVNTPLPVTGSLSLSGNNATNPFLVRDVDNAGRQAFVHRNVCFLFTDIPCNDSLTAPADSRLVVETASVIVDVPVGQKPLAVIFAGSAGAIPNSGYAIPLQLQGTFPTGVGVCSTGAGNCDTFVGTQVLRAYVERALTLTLFSARNSTTDHARVQFTVSGYFVKCGPGSDCPLP